MKIRKIFLCCLLFLMGATVGKSFPGDAMPLSSEDASDATTERVSLRRGRETLSEERQEEQTSAERSHSGSSFFSEEESSFESPSGSRQALLGEEVSANSEVMELNAPSSIHLSSLLPSDENSAVATERTSSSVGHLMTSEGVRDLISVPPENLHKALPVEVARVSRGANTISEVEREKVIRVLELKSDLFKMDEFSQEMKPDVAQEINVLLEELPSAANDPKLLQQLRNYRDHAITSFENRRMNVALSWLAMAKKMKEAIGYDLKAKKATEVAAELALVNEEASTQEVAKAGIWKATVTTTQEWVDASKSYLHASNDLWLAEKNLSDVTKSGSQQDIAQATKEVTDRSNEMKVQESSLAIKASKREHLFNAATILDRAVALPAGGNEALWSAIKEAQEVQKIAALL